MKKLLATAMVMAVGLTATAGVLNKVDNALNKADTAVTKPLNNATNNVTLDSKLLLCLNSDGTNKSKEMIGNFPLLEKGINSISWTGNITKIELTPRTAFI